MYSDMYAVLVLEKKPANDLTHHDQNKGFRPRKCTEENEIKLSKIIIKLIWKIFLLKQKQSYQPS